MKKLVIIGCLLAIFVIFFAIYTAIIKEEETVKNYVFLPSPLIVNMTLEDAMSRRMSVREFSDKRISDEKLSTLLWAAYGCINSEELTNHSVNMTSAVQIYVLEDNGVYKYNPYNHSLILWQNGDFRAIGEHDTAQLKLGIVWNSSKCKSEAEACTFIGEIGQNLYFVSNALSLGMVVTASNRHELNRIGLSPDEVPKIIVPLGYPKQVYDFSYDPLLSELTIIQNSSISLLEVIKARNEPVTLKEDLSAQEQTQMIWAAYGFSSLIDNLNDRRHRTTPSAFGRYPLQFFIANHSGIYLYIPETHSLKEVGYGDKREEIIKASQSIVASAPCIIISVLDKSLESNERLWYWYYEAGATAYNVLLEAIAWNLSVNVVTSINNIALLSVIGLNTEYLPLSVILIGRKSE